MVERPVTGAVHVWLIRADVPAPVLAALEAVLDGGERQRAARASASRRPLFTAVHGTARFIMGGYLGIPPEHVRWRRGPNGKPELAGADADVHVSLSHSGDLAALAIADGRPTGVDIQRFPRAADAVRVAGRFFPPDEARFVAAGREAAQAARFARLWARKEACVKVTGGQLLQGLRLAVGAGRITVRDAGGLLPGPYLVQDVPAPPGFAAAVAVAGPRPSRVTRYWWRA